MPRPIPFGDPVIHEGRMYRFEIDELYHPSHSGDPEFGDVDYKNECDKLDDGSWVALQVVVFVPCGNGPRHCGACDGWVEDMLEPAIGGIVVENDDSPEALLRIAKGWL